jgi:hypothetical protein
MAPPPTGVRPWGPLRACTGPAPWPATSASGGGQVAGELLRLVRTKLQPFELLVLLAGRRISCQCP